MSKMVYLPYVRFEQEEGEGRGCSCRTVSIRLQMLDTAQVEYRKLSEVHLQCRVDDNQPE